MREDKDPFASVCSMEEVIEGFNFMSEEELFKAYPIMSDRDLYSIIEENKKDAITRTRKKRR